MACFGIYWHVLASFGMFMHAYTYFACLYMLIHILQDFGMFIYIYTYLCMSLPVNYCLCFSIFWHVYTRQCSFWHDLARLGMF